MSKPDNIFRALVDLALPVIGLNVLNILALVVDTAMCGRLADEDLALTALSFATQVVFLLYVAIMGLTVGSVALVARAYGAKQTERVNHLLIQSTMFTVIVGVGVAILGNLFAPFVLRTLGAEPHIQVEALKYLRPLLWATMFQYLVVLYAGVLRGVGNTRLPFLVALAANGVNIFLNYGFILGNMGFPALGLQGAAYGTVTSQVFSVVLIVFLLRRGTVKDLRLPLRPRKLDGTLAKELFRVGAPASLDMLILNAAFLSIVGMLGRIDELAVAAHGVGLRIQALAFVPGMSISQATAAMVGQSLGAGEAERARKVTRASLVLCTAIMSVLAISFVIGVAPVVRIFDLDPNTGVGEFAVTWIRLLGYGMPIVGLHIAFIGMLQGAGATNTSLRINFFGTVLFQIPLSYLLGFTFELGAWGVWAAFPLGFVVKAVLGALAYRSGTWATLGARVEQ